MNRPFLKYFLLLLAVAMPALFFGQLTLKVTELPANTPAGETIYLAGNFQGWNPGDPDYQLSQNADGTWQITISPAPGLLKFKFTRGSWQTVEGNANGGFLPDRTYNYTGGPDLLQLEILSWEDLGGSNSTATPNVSVLDENFYIPQLDRYRRVWVYLPPDYDDNPDKHYRVLYLHDGQNVFDQATSFAGEWEVDESLNELFLDGDEGCIVVAIDNGADLRINEYAPWYNDVYQAGGEGKAYVDFIVETLKPFMDSNFRTLSDRQHTGIMGSSLGGLISHYAMLEYPQVFGKIGVFSPAYWFNPEIFDYTAQNPIAEDTRIYLLAGQLEGNGSVVSDVDQMQSVLLQSGFPSENIKVKIDPDGEHSEWYWAREFPAAYLWLFEEVAVALDQPAQTGQLDIFPNPADSLIYVQNCSTISKPTFRLSDAGGKVLLKGKLLDCTIDVSGLPAGVYQLQVCSGRKALAVKTIIVE